MSDKGEMFLTQLFSIKREEMDNPEKDGKMYILIGAEDLSIKSFTALIDELQMCCRETIEVFFEPESSFVITDSVKAAKLYGDYIPRNSRGNYSIAETHGVLRGEISH
jgi:hypothetical protein